MAKTHETKINLGNNFLTPDVIGRNSLTLLDCIAEIVANSLDWRITKSNPKETTRIRIKLSDNSIQIIDNGVGMTLEQLDTAIDLAEAGNDIRSKLDDEERKGMYGLGMKVAALSLGWKFTVNTVSIETPNTELKFEFNARQLKNKKSNYLKELKIIEDNKAINSPLAKLNSGTSIKIEDLEKEVVSFISLGKDLEERFAPDIKNLSDQGKLEFIIENDEGGKYELNKRDNSAEFEDDILKLDFEKPNKWSKKKEYKYTGSDGKEYQLRGFIQLLSARSVVEQKFGLNLYYQGQLIERYHKSKDGLFTIAGRTGEKTYGELHLDGCIPDNVKAKGFLNNKAFKEVRELIREDLEVYKSLSPTSSNANQKVKEEINKRKGLGSNVPTPPPPTNGPDDSKKPDAAAETDPLKDMPEGTIKIKDHLYIQIHNTWVHEKEIPKRNVSWMSFYTKSKLHNDLQELRVWINPTSALYKAIQELYKNQAEQNKILSFFRKMAISECINEKLISEHGYSTEDAREITDNKVYPAVLKMKIY